MDTKALEKIVSSKCLHPYLKRHNALLLIIVVTFHIVVAISCCEGYSYKNLDTKVADIQTTNIFIEDVAIPIDSITNPSYPVFHNSLINGISYLSGYNRKTHSIDVFDLNSKVFFKHIGLEHHGPNGIEDVRGLYIHNWDSVFISSTFNIYMINSNGKIIKSFNLLDKDLFVNLAEGSLTSTNSFGLYYSFSRNSVFLNYIPTNVEFGTKEFYTRPFIAEYYLNDNSLKLIPVEYSKYFTDNHVGFLSIPAVTIYNNTIYVCFQGESNIYTYDLEKNKTTVHGGQSSYSINLATPIDLNAKFERKLRHRAESPMFFNIIYDPFRELFYR